MGNNGNEDRSGDNRFVELGSLFMRRFRGGGNTWAVEKLKSFRLNFGAAISRIKEEAAVVPDGPSTPHLPRRARDGTSRSGMDEGHGVGQS